MTDSVASVLEKRLHDVQICKDSYPDGKLSPPDPQ